MEKIRNERKRWHVAWFAVMVLSTIFSTIHGCNVGTDNPNAYTDNMGSYTDGRTFFIDGAASSCCGKLTNWVFYANATGDVTAMVWRPVAGNLFKLVFMQVIPAVVGLNTAFPPSDVLILEDDIVGWKTDTAELIPYSAGGPSPSTQDQPWATPAVNADLPWGNTPDTTNTYAFGAAVTENLPPTITGGAVTIGDMDINQEIFTPLVITDPDTADFLQDTTVDITDPVPTDFSITDNGADFTISSGASLTVGTYELEVTVTDLCDASVSATVTVTVENPTLVYDPSTPATSYSGSVSDITTGETRLYPFLVNDTEPVTCSTDNTKFDIRDEPPYKVLWLKNVLTTDLDYDDLSAETMTISCTDGTNTITRPFSVSISDEPAVISNLGGTTAVGDGTAIGTPVHNFTVTDQDDEVSCTVSDPDFTISPVTTGVAGVQEFTIDTAAALDAGVTPSYTLTVSCDDGSPNPLVTDTHTITVTDAVPVFDPTYAATVYSGTISDNTTAATSIYAFSVIDADPVTCSTDNPKFEIREVPPNHELWLSDVAEADLDFDDDPIETMIISCDDTTTTITRPFSVNIDDEPSVISNLGVTIDPIGDLTATNTIVHTFTVTDQDDEVDCTVSDPDFSINKVTAGGVTGEQTFDIVTAAGLNEDNFASYTLTVTCDDDQNIVTDTQTIMVFDEPPTVTGLNVTSPTTLIDGDQGTQTLLASFTVDDANDLGVNLGCSIQPINSDFFQLTGTEPNLNVETIIGESLVAASSPYLVEILCNDDEAGNTVSGTVTVLVTNSPPEYVGLPATLSPDISDATEDDTPLHYFSVDDTPTDTITCFPPVVAAPYDDDFELRGTSPDFELWLLAANDLNYDNDASIPVTITCTDSFTNITEDFTVTVFDQDPDWTGFPASTFTMLDEEPNQLLVHTFYVDDSDDDIICGVDQLSAEADHFEIRPQTPPEFQLWYQGRPPASLDQTVQSSHNVTIICNDATPLYNHSEIVTVDLQNSSPVFVNLPDASVTIAESDLAQTSVFTVSVSDQSEANCYLTDTVEAAGIEPLVKGTVALPITEYTVNAHHTTGFDYENVGTIIVRISCSDGSNTITDTLTITVENSAPVVINPGGSATVDEDEIGTLTLKTINFEKFDAEDASCTMTNADGGPFDIGGTNNNQIIKTAGALESYDTKPEYNLVVTCTDGELTTTDSFTVSVDNKGPDITNFPTGVEILEGQYDQALLKSFTLSEDATNCEQVGTVEPEFVTKYEPSTSQWGLYYLGQDAAGKSLSYDTKPFYNIQVSCTDASGATGCVKTITVTVQDNEAPVFTNIGGLVPTKVEVTAKDYVATDTLFTVEGDDPTNPSDDITFTMVSCEPAATCNFTMTPDGAIVTNVDLYSHPDDTYIMKVKVEDQYNPTDVTQDLILKINDNNTVPVFTNLPKKDKLGILENQHAADETVFQFSVEDPDIATTDTLKYFCTFPDGGAQYYYCDEDTGELKTKDVLDFEAMGVKEYRVEVYVNDGYVDSEVQELTVRVNDENEPPLFGEPTWTISSSDEGDHGKLIACPNFKSGFTDEDVNDVHKYTMSCTGGEGAFVMDKDTGCVTMLMEWDLDRAPRRRLFDSIPCTVTVTDLGGLETTADLNIEINAAEDEPIYLDQTSYVMCANAGDTSGTLDAVGFTDQDVEDNSLASNNDHTYSLSGNSLFSVNGDGDMTYGDVSGYSTGTAFDLVLSVTDEAGNVDESPVCAIICPAPPAAAAASASASSSSSSSTSDLLLWLIPTILLSLLALGLAAYCLRRCLTGGCGRFRPLARAGRAPVPAVRAVQPMRVVKKPVLVQKQVVRKVVAPVKVVQTPVRQVVAPVKTIAPVKAITPVKPITPVRPATPGQFSSVQDLPMLRYYARDTYNMAANQNQPM